MSANIVALARGGFSAQGGCDYDARDDVVLIHAFDNELVTLLVQMPDTISTINSDTSGVTASDPVISGASFTSILSGFTTGDSIQFDVLMSTGEMRILFLEINQQPVSAVSSPSGDYGTFSP